MNGLERAQLAYDNALPEDFYEAGEDDVENDADVYDDLRERLAGLDD